MNLDVQPYGIWLWAGSFSDRKNQGRIRPMDGVIQKAEGEPTMVAGGCLIIVGGGGICEGTNVTELEFMEAIEAGEKADLQGLSLPINALDWSEESTLLVTDVGEVNEEMAIVSGFHYKVADGLCGV